MRMPAVLQDRLWCTSRAHASEQEWQPMQRSMRGAVRIFKAGSLFRIQHRVYPVSVLSPHRLVRIDQTVGRAVVDSDRAVVVELG
jgi:hypothetical protein